MADSGTKQANALADDAVTELSGGTRGVMRKGDAGDAASPAGYMGNAGGGDTMGFDPPKAG